MKKLSVFLSVLLISMNLFADDSHVIALYFDSENTEPKSASIYLLEQGPSKEFPLIYFYERMSVLAQKSKEGIPFKEHKSEGPLRSLYCANGALDIANCVFTFDLTPKNGCFYDTRGVNLKCDFFGREATEISSVLLKSTENFYALQIVGAKTKEQFSLGVEPEHVRIEFITPKKK